MNLNNSGPDFANLIEKKKSDLKQDQSEKEIIELNNKVFQLNKEITELTTRLKSKEQPKRGEITLAQQLLILHYLGLLNEIDLNTKSKSFILSKILNRSHDNIRKVITYINSPKISLSKIKNIENLELVLGLFESLKLSEAADRVKVDLKKLNKE